MARDVKSAKELFTDYGGKRVECSELSLSKGEISNEHVEFRIREADLDAYLEGLLAQHSGRIKERLYQQGVSVERTAKLEECLQLINNSLGDLVRGFSPSVDPRNYVAQLQATIAQALR